MAAGAHFEKIKSKTKLCIDLKWREMRSKVIFGHPKWVKSDFRNGPPAAILKKKSCVLIWNGEKSIRKWFSFIQNGRRQPFCENLKKNQTCVLIWNGQKCDRKRFRSSKMAAGSHFVKKNIKVAYWSEMAINEIKSDFRSSKMVAGSHFVEKKLRIDLKWREMQSKVIFGNPKWPPAAILWKFKKKSKLRIDLKWREMWSKAIFRSSKMAAGSHFVNKNIKVAYWSEMARNAIKSDFRSSKMVAGSHFVKKKLRIDLKWREMRSKVIFIHPKWPLAAILWKKKLRIDLKWREMQSKVIFGHPKWPPAAILWTKSKKIKVEYWSEMARNAIEFQFRSSKMGGGGGEGASQWPACKPFGDIHSICPWAHTPILVFYYLSYMFFFAAYNV